MTAPAMPEQPYDKRYMQLVNWLWELGLCWRCRHTLAGAQVEREITGVKGLTTTLTCSTQDECRAAGKHGWHTMPATNKACKR